MQIVLDTKSKHGLVPITVVRKKVKNINLRARSDNTFVVSAPYFTSETRIRTFLENERDWIVRRMDKNYMTKEDMLQLTKGNDISYLGKKYHLDYRVGVPDIVVLGDYFFVFSDKNDHDRILENWWRKEAERIFQEDFSRLYEGIFLPLGVPRPTLVVNRTTTRWGCCYYAKKCIRLSENLLWGDREVIEYVVLHELTHMICHDHSARFYSFIEKYMPDYKLRVKRLKLLNRM